jgi:hypothetical protein
MTALDISPGAIWKPATGDLNPSDLLRDGFRDLRTFVATAAERGEAMVIDVS